MEKVYNFLPLPDYYRKKFLEYGFRHTQNGAFETIDTNHFFCPKCYSMDRERLYAWYMNNFIKLNANQSILDFAPSKGLKSWIKKTYACNYVSADLYMDDVDVKVDIEHMAIFEDNIFDFVLCSHVLEHVNNDLDAMREVFRVLKVGGKGIIMSPILRNFDSVDEDTECKSVAERWRRFGQDDHVRLYSKNVFVQRLENVGFKVTTMTESTFGLIAKKSYGLPDNCNLYIVEK